MTERASHLEIATEASVGRLDELLDFIYTRYVASRPDRFINVLKTKIGGVPFLSFTLLSEAGSPALTVEIRGSQPLSVTIAPCDERTPQALLDRVREDMIIGVQVFEEQLRKTSIYFAWASGKELRPEKLRERSSNKIFLETQIFLSLLFIIGSLVLFSLLGWLTPIVLLALQFIMVLYSNKIIARTADWHLTPENPRIDLLQIQLAREEEARFRQRFQEGTVTEIKREIYAKTLAAGKPIDCDTAGQVLSRYGLECRPEDIAVKSIDVRGIVRRAAEKFQMPMPTVLVANTMLPNAAASGPSPSRGVVLVTTGLLVQLEEPEIESVVGHEFGHLKERDPLVIFALTAAEFLFRFYVLFSLVPYLFISFLGYAYLIGIMSLIFFVGKFFEARADLVSAKVVGQPQVLAQALRKIGFRRLQMERVPSYRLQEWTGFDLHPPIYFRVERLEKLSSPEEIRHPFLESARDVIRGFLSSF